MRGSDDPHSGAVCRGWLTDSPSQARAQVQEVQSRNCRTFSRSGSGGTAGPERPGLWIVPRIVRALKTYEAREVFCPQSSRST